MFAKVMIKIKDYERLREKYSKGSERANDFKAERIIDAGIR